MSATSRRNASCWLPAYDKGITIDARAHRSGIGVYTTNLIREIHGSCGMPVHALTGLKQQPFFAPLCARTSVVDAPIYSLREQWDVARSVRREAVLHVPHYNFPLLYKGTLLVTIHDVTHLVDTNYRNSWKSRVYAAPMLARSVRRAQHIFTVSEYSKGRIVELLQADPEKISVVYHGIGPEFGPGDREEAKVAVQERFGLLGPFVLYVGNLKPHKNIEALLRAWRDLRAKGNKTFALVLAGGDQSGLAHLSGLASELGVSPHLISDATNAEIAQLYRAAELLVLPSFEEGFGLTVLEAMACGTPVLCSNRASLPEVAGDAAYYFDPADFHQLSDSLDCLLHSPSLQSSLRTKGFTRSRGFTWKNAAEQHVDIYRKFVGGS